MKDNNNTRKENQKVGEMKEIKDKETKLEIKR